MSSLHGRNLYCFCNHDRRRINAAEKAEVVAAVWGTEFIKLLAPLSILHQDDLEELDEFILLLRIILPGAIRPSLQLVLVQNS